MFTINEIRWYLKFVPSDSLSLARSDNSKALGVCDNNAQIIYINNNLSGQLLKKVICHELTHAAMFSYGIELNIEQEELFADFIATYGEEIINITNSLFKSLKGDSI